MAKKNNKNPDEIDLTTFAFAAAGDPKMPGVPGCGGCHPGGGGMEFDRDGAKKHHSEWYKEIRGEEKPVADEGNQEEN